MKKMQKRIISIFLAVLIAISGIVPAMTAFGANGVEGYYDMQIFYADTNTIVPTYGDDGESEFVQYITEGDELNLTYKLIDSAWPDNGYVKWYSDAPALVDVTQEGVVKAFDSSKGAVIHAWIDNEVKTIPLVGGAIAKVIEKALFNDYVNVDTLDTEAIVSIVTAALGSDSIIADYIEAYEGNLIDSLREYLDKINSIIHCDLYDGSGVIVASDKVRFDVLRNNEWYANFLPNGTHITNKSQIPTTQAKGSTVQLYAITTPQRLNFGVVYSVKSTSIFSQGKSVATVTDGGLVTFRNTGTATIVVSPDSEQVIQKILEMVNYFYKLENTGTLNTDKIAEILIKYMGIDINRAVLAGILDAAFAIYKVAGDAADPVQLTATAVEILANIILQMAYNDSITFTVVEATPITSFDLGGNLTVKEGTQSQLTIENMQPSTGDKSDLVWESADPSIASVDENGIITGLDAGGSLGALSSQQVEISCTSTTNNVKRTVTVTVTGKTGKYISGVNINGPDLVEIDTAQKYTYSVFPSRVAEADNLYITWGMVTGKDEDGNDIITWTEKDAPPVSDGIGQIDYLGNYKSLNGGASTIAIMAKTGYYLSNGEFFEISSKTVTKEIKTGIPIDNITINVTGGTGVADKSIDRDKKVIINGVEYEYATAQIGVATAYDGKGAALSASIYPNDATNQKLRWVIDNTNVYQFEDLSSDTHSVKVKQRAAREYADTFNVYAVSADGRVKSNVITVCVTRNMSTGNRIDAESVTMLNGKSQDLTHTMTFDGSWTGGAYACYKCNWYSSDESVVSVKQKGNDNGDAIITANDVGTATITCVSADGAFVDSVEVTVKPDKTYLKEIIDLCEKTIVYQTPDNRADYKKYMRKLDLAYIIYYEEDMAAQVTCDTYAEELLYAFIRVGGFVGINSVEVLGTNKTKLDSDYVSVKVSSTKSYKAYSYDFDYAVSPVNAMYSNIVWTSSNNSISVDKNGRCTPTNNEACSATITCTVTDYNGTQVSNSKVVAFARTKATGVTLDREQIQGAKIGEQTTLVAKVAPLSTFGNSNASCTDVSWYSTNTNVATVDQNGVVSFVYGGSATIVCTTQDGGFTARCYISVVTNYDALKLLINQYNDLNLNKSSYYPETWARYSAALNTASSMVARGGYTQEEVDAAYAELEASYKGLKKYIYINYIELYLDGEATSEFYQYDLSLLKEGISYKNAKLNLKVRLFPNNASYDKVIWKSSTDLISVTNEGVCSPTSNKSCYGMITCTVSDHYGNQFEDTVFVSFSYRPVTAVKISEDMISGNVGEKHQMSCIIEPTGDSFTHIGKADIQDYYWESDNDEVATIDENGVVTFIGAGSTTIRCVSYDGGHNAECKVSTNGDRTALSAAIEKYQDVDYTQYEYNYAMRFKTAYEKAQSALTDHSLNQTQIDTAANNLITAGEALASHPYIHVTSIPVTYTTEKKAITWSGVTSGTVGSNDAVSIDLSSNYASDNSANRIMLNATPAPANSMYKEIAWTVNENHQMNVAANGSELTLAPSKNDGAYAIVTVTTTDHFGAQTKRTLYITMADKVGSGLTINNATSLTMYPTSTPHQISWTVNGSPRFDKVFFTSSNNAVATVNENGVITAVDKGRAVITVKTLDGGYSKNVTVDVYTDFSKLAEKVKEYQKLLDDVQDDYAYTEESLAVLREKVVSADAMVKDGKATQAEVDAEYDELVNAYKSLVKFAVAEGVEIKVSQYADEKVITVVNDGFIRYNASVINDKTVQLEAVSKPAGSFYKTVEWVSDKPDTITVDEDGLVTNTTALSGVAKITCIITTVFGDKYTASTYVSFARNAVQGVYFDKDMIYGAPQEVKNVNTKFKIESEINALANLVIKDCLYESTNPSVATVNDKGDVTFITQGEATIKVTSLDGGYTGSIKVMTTWDTGALQAAIADAELLNYKNYEYSYGMAFKNAYDNAVKVYENPLASQATIDEACTALQESMTELDDHPYITPSVTLITNGKTVVNGKACETINNVANIGYALNDGAMYDSIKVEATGEGITATSTDTGVTIQRSESVDTPAHITVTVRSKYGDETKTEYDVTLVDRIINITDIQLTADGEYVTSSISRVYSKFSDFKGMQLGYVAIPVDATKPKSVTWESSSAVNLRVDENGFVTLLGGARPSYTATITCTVTNDDDTFVSKSVQITISRA